jgi:tetratricopeptide (TPR) repeat protein
MIQTGLDQLSNAALDAIEAGRWEEAERLCERLLKEHPDQIDGLDRLGSLREAQGRFQDAADAYARGLELMRRVSPPLFGPEVIEEFKRRRDGALSGAARREPPPRSAP